MSELRVDNIVDMGGSGAPKLRKGASVTGISTITQAYWFLVIYVILQCS